MLYDDSDSESRNTAYCRCDYSTRCCSIRLSELSGLKNNDSICSNLCSFLLKGFHRKRFILFLTSKRGVRPLVQVEKVSQFARVHAARLNNPNDLKLEARSKYIYFDQFWS